ncbi:hypothetical protein K8I28_16520 [bacterium]|nr:hypothetical protein [bacterium]
MKDELHSRDRDLTPSVYIRVSGSVEVDSPGVGDFEKFSGMYQVEGVHVVEQHTTRRKTVKIMRIAKMVRFKEVKKMIITEQPGKVQYLAKKNAGNRVMFVWNLQINGREFHFLVPVRRDFKLIPLEFVRLAGYHVSI